jgi:methylated-DNA-[protein]-cysteine S-methyltransferase
MTEVVLCDTPCGCVRLRVCEGRLVGVDLCAAGECRGSAGVRRPSPPGTARFTAGLDRYWRGLDPGLRPEEINLSACTPFQQQVYGELMGVGFGEVVTYGGLAERIRRPGAARAVGFAMARNPVPVFIPCHRVVAAGNRIGGFGSGLGWKRRLLVHEGWTLKDGTISRG